MNISIQRLVEVELQDTSLPRIMIPGIGSGLCVLAGTGVLHTQGSCAPQPAQYTSSGPSLSRYRARPCLVPLCSFSVSVPCWYRVRCAACAVSLLASCSEPRLARSCLWLEQCCWRGLAGWRSFCATCLWWFLSLGSFSVPALRSLFHLPVSVALDARGVMCAWCPSSTSVQSPG